MSKLRIALALVTSLVVSGAIIALVLAPSSGGARARSPRVGSVLGLSPVSAPGRDGSTAQFAFLARQTSNRCGLQPSELNQMPSRMRLQGSCCFPMNLAAYQAQVRRLRAYRGVPTIPRDPYDVPVSLAKRLLAYDHTIHLSPAHARTYSHAMHMSRLKGPCCCPCWRWYAFRGLSKHLIADLGWRAARIATLTELLEGCGGPADHA